MPIISVEIKKTIDEREMQKTTKEKHKKIKKSTGNRIYSKRVGAKWFSCAFKLGFLINKPGFHILLNPCFKMTTSFANITRTTARKKNIYILGKISNH